MAKRKPCDFCSGEYEADPVEGRNGFYLWTEAHPENNLLSFLAQANDEEGYLIEGHMDVQMNYCPVCGRKLIN